jgi:hypothetical protein
LFGVKDSKSAEAHMARYRLLNGREVYLSRFTLAPTYAGLAEGSPEMASPFILERVAQKAALLLPPANPLVVVPPPRMPLPCWLCVAELGSRRGARESDPDYNSRLFVCWFAENTEWSIDALVEAVLPHLDWERVAEDYDIMDF